MRRLLITGFLVASLVAPLHADAQLVLGYRDIRDDAAADGDRDPHATSTRDLAMHLDWLRAHGYVPVSAQAVHEARTGGRPLPERAVLLAFDGGLRSTYTHAWPLLRAFGYPAVVGLPTSRIGTATALDWNQLREMQRSGQIEFATQGHALDVGMPATAQGDVASNALARQWRGTFESDADYRSRLRRDLETSRDLIRQHLGMAPRFVVWPMSAATGPADAVAAELGLRPLAAVDGRTGTADLAHTGRPALAGQPPARFVMHGGQGVGDLVYEMRRDITLDGIRAIHVDLAPLAAGSAGATRANIDRLVERVRQLRPTHVVLQPWSDADGDGRVDGAYFPGGGLPVREDLFGHVVARLASADVAVYAALPAQGLADPRRAHAELVAAGEVRGVVLEAPGTDLSDALRWRPALRTVRPDAAQATTDLVLVRIPAGASQVETDRIVDAVATAGGLARTLFQLQVPAGPATAASTRALEAQARRVLARGGRHLAYRPDDVLRDQPPLDSARAVISARAFPYLER